MKVALYARVSSREQAIHGLSIEAQLKALREWSEGKTVVGEYVDEGVTARKSITKRPELQRLLTDVEAGRVDLIAFTKLDRWTRNVREYYKAADVLDAHNVAWKAIQEDYETETASGRLKVNLMLSIGQDEADRTGERVKATNALKRSKGEFCSGNVAIGLKLENKHLVPSEDAWKVRAMFDAYITTGAVYSAQGRLQEQGITIGGRSLRYIIDNANYVRTGVISEDVWKKSREIRSVPRPRSVRTRTYLFNGLVFCGECGKRMTGMYSKGNYYYRCPTNYIDRSCPVTRCYNEAKIERYLLEHVMQYVKGINLEIRRKSKRPPDTSKLRSKLDKLTDLYLSDLISREKYEVEYTAAKKALEEAESVPKPIDENEILSVLAAYDGLSREGKRTFWLTLLKTVTLHKDAVEFTLSYIS